MRPEYSDNTLLSFLEGELAPEDAATVTDALKQDSALAKKCRDLEQVLEVELLLRDQQETLAEDFVEEVCALLPARPDPVVSAPTHSSWQLAFHNRVADWLVERLSPFAAMSISSVSVVCTALLLIFYPIQLATKMQPAARVLVPNVDITPGMQLTAAMFRTELRPLAEIPSQAITDFSKLEGSYAKTLVIADYPIDQRYTSKERPLHFFAPHIPDGYRVVAVAIDTLRDPGVAIMPGKSVDVVLAQKRGSAEDLYRLVSSAQIVAVQDESMKDDTARFVTLMVRAEDASRIDLARDSGQLLLGTPLQS